MRKCKWCGKETDWMEEGLCRECYIKAEGAQSHIGYYALVMGLIYAAFSMYFDVKSGRFVYSMLEVAGITLGSVFIMAVLLVIAYIVTRLYLYDKSNLYLTVMGIIITVGLVLYFSASPEELAAHVSVADLQMEHETVLGELEAAQRSSDNYEYALNEMIYDIEKIVDDMEISGIYDAYDLQYYCDELRDVTSDYKYY